MGARALVPGLALSLTLAACGSPGGSSGDGGATIAWQAHVTDTRFRTAEHMQAGFEMQLSGEPFAQLLGFQLAGFDRFAKTPDLYLDPATQQTRTELLGYATAVESYEYSKQPMNMLSWESGGGLSMMFAPAINPTAQTGDPAYDLLANRFQALAASAGATGPAGTALIASPPPSSNPLNYYGWPGLWPVFAEFRSFDPAIMPIMGVTRGCSFSSGYGASAGTQQIVSNYECGSNSLHLINREAQVEKVLAPDALGWAVWKQSLWVINYWGTLHDSAGFPVLQVNEADLAQVGVDMNTVVGKIADPTDATGMRLVDGNPGTYLGDNAGEGWQGLLMLEEIDEKARLLLGTLTSGDGAALGGFGSLGDALAYDPSSPLRYWPAAVRVTETPTAPSADLADKLFPQPTAFAIDDAQSRLADLAGVGGGYATWLATLDRRNPDVGGLPQWRATWDGAPFAADNGLPDGEDSPHDRALAVLKVVIANLDRLHFDPQARVLVDRTTVAGGQPVLGRHVSTVELSTAIIALRTMRRGLTSSLTLYSNDTPDTRGLPTLLDGTQWRTGTGAGARADELLQASADFLAQALVDANGKVANGFDLAANAADAGPTTLEAEAGALRALLEAYLATSDERFRDRAVAIYGDLEARFWREDGRVFRTVADDPGPTIRYTPAAFGALWGALRQYWKLEARRPGQEDVAQTLLLRLARTFKLVVNGWDDRDGDQKVGYPDECTGGGLQLAERALTGDLSRPQDNGDRDKDCVREISVAMLPAALGSEIVLEPK